MTGLVFGKVFFAGSDPLIDTLKAFGVFFIGFVARPIGAAIFSNPIASVAHGNYIGCNGWVECFPNAGGMYLPSNDGGAGQDGDTGAATGTGCRAP